MASETNILRMSSHYQSLLEFRETSGEIAINVFEASPYLIQDSLIRMNAQKDFGTF